MTVKTSNPFAMFGTDSNKEMEGIVLDFGDFHFKIRRSGGSNIEFQKTFERRIRPYRRQIDLGTLPAEVSNRVLAEVFADSIIIGWGSKAHGENFMVGAKGEKIAFSRDAVTQMLLDLPALFSAIREHAQEIANFQSESEELDTKN